MFRVALRLLLAAALGAAPSLAFGDVYRWVDDAGATHYATTRDAIPRRFRGAAEAIPEPRATIGNPSSAQPPAPPAPPLPVEPPPPSAAAPSATPAAETAPSATAPAATPPAEAAPTATAPAETPPSASAPPPAPPPATEPVPTSGEPQSSAPIAEPAPPPVGTAPSTNRAVEDPRVEEIAQLEGQIERDREALRQLISTPRWDSEELASDPRVREISERLPRLQAELAALRTEAER